MNCLEELKASTSYQKRKPSPLKLLQIKPFNYNHLMNMQSAVENRDLIETELWKTSKNERFMKSSKSIKYMNKFNKYNFIETPKSCKSEIRASPKTSNNIKMKTFESKSQQNMSKNHFLDNKKVNNYESNNIFNEKMSNSSKDHYFKIQKISNFCDKTYEDYPVNYLSVQNPKYIKSYYLAYDNLVQNSVTMGTTTNSFKFISKHLKPELYTHFFKMGRLRKAQVSSYINKKGKKVSSSKISPQYPINNFDHMDIFKNLKNFGKEGKEEKIEAEEEMKKSNGKFLSVKKFNFLKNKQFTKCLDGKLEAIKKGLEEQLKI